MIFADLGLGPELLKAVEEAGYKIPTPIQEQAIPVVLMGRDVLGVAQTGTGKTAGFTLPMIEILAGSRAKARMPRSLILTPTRELASQAAENFEKYGKYHKLTMAKLIGGESFVDQEKLLDRGVDVLIATPGRLLDLIDRGRILLNDVKILVIDEADRMLDMGFIPDVERIVGFLPKMRQTLFFSATMAPEIRRLADAFLMNPKEISVAPPASTADLVEQFLVVCEEIDKREALRHLIRLEDVKNALIFCNRKRDVDILYRSLAKHEFDVVQLHGDMAQSARTETLERFKREEVRLMVCSDVAARGLDISGLSHVFNFDVPIHSEDYVHRIGRTGRAGKQGRAFTIATPDDGKFVAAIVKLIGKEIPRTPIEGLPELALDPEGDGRRRRSGRGKPERRSDRGEHRGERSEHRGDRNEHRGGKRDKAAPRPPQPEPVPIAAAEPPRRPPAGRPPERPSERPRRDRHDRGRPDRRRVDELGIGAMDHPENVIGFGSAMPDFMRRAVVLPPPVERRGPDDLIGDEDFSDDLVAAASPAEEISAEPTAAEDKAPEAKPARKKASEKKTSERKAAPKKAAAKKTAEKKPAAKKPGERKSAPRRKRPAEGSAAITEPAPQSPEDVLDAAPQAE